MAEGNGAVDALEMRVMEVRSALDVGMTEIKGSLALLVQSADYTKQELARRDREREADLLAQARKDEDQEKRLRSLERHVYKVAGAGAVGSLIVGAAAGVAMHFWK